MVEKEEEKEEERGERRAEHGQVRAWRQSMSRLAGRPATPSPPSPQSHHRPEEPGAERGLTIITTEVRDGARTPCAEATAQGGKTEPVKNEDSEPPACILGSQAPADTLGYSSGVSLRTPALVEVLLITGAHHPLNLLQVGNWGPDILRLIHLCP